RQASRDVLNSLYVSNQPHVVDGRYFLWIGFNATHGGDKTQQHTPRNPENALFRVKFDALVSQPFEG
ncbi:hypothetical protein, partial [Escherichia coli]|uniref:hypothetical protein n=1 Tax=Escherichia coli TaxID=562 RepID=UPI001CBE082B